MPSRSVWTVGLCAASLVGAVCVATAQPPRTISNAEEYFPDQRGNTWTYQGRFIEGEAVDIAEKRFVNVSSVVGMEEREGLDMLVFHDTNPGDQGPSDSYYVRDAAGIRYYGSDPGTPLERQLLPYQIIRFPLEVPSSFQQVKRAGLNLGVDIDRDGESERVDVDAVVSVVGDQTVSVPVGRYTDAIRLEARMTMTVHLSNVKQTVEGTDVMHAWFGRGVGLLKYQERQTVPSFRSQTARVIEVVEELERATVGGVSLGSEPSTSQ